MTRDRRRLALTLALLGLSQACTCGDEQATLTVTPAQAKELPSAVGASFRLQMDDACRAGPLSGCTTETITEVVEVEVDGAVLDVSPASSEGPGVFDAVAAGPGTTDLSITAQFDGEGQSGRRSVSQTFTVMEVQGVWLAPRCTSAYAEEPWVIPLDGVVTWDLAYLGEEGRELFHHDVDWGAELNFEFGAPAGFDDAAPESPSTAEADFDLAGPHQIYDAITGNLVTELFVFDAAAVDQLVIDADLVEITAGETPAAVTPGALVEGAELCTSAGKPDLVITLSILDPSVCSFAANEQVAVAEIDPGATVEVFGLLPGQCVLEAALDDDYASLTLDVYAGE